MLMKLDKTNAGSSIIPEISRWIQRVVLAEWILAEILYVFMPHTEAVSVVMIRQPCADHTTEVNFLPQLLHSVSCNPKGTDIPN